MHNELLPWLEQKAIEAAIEYAKEYDRYDSAQCHAYCEAIAKLTAESHHRVMERIGVKAEELSKEEGMYREYPEPAQRYEDLHRDRLEEEKHQRLEEEGMYCTPYDPETDTEPTENRYFIDANGEYIDM